MNPLQLQNICAATIEMRCSARDVEQGLLFRSAALISEHIMARQYEVAVKSAMHAHHVGFSAKIGMIGSHGMDA